MKLKPFSSAAREVSAIGQGTWYFERADRASAIAALRRGLDLGMNHIDTAEMYGSGIAEEIVGEAIAGRRNEAFIVSKVLPENASRAGTRAACERSLKRLKADRIDCYLLHWRGRHPLEDTFAGFEDLHRAGKILSWGVSNFDVADLEAALAIAGEDAIACNQVLYHLQERGIEHGVIPWCEAHGVAVVAYSPFGHSSFPDARSTGGRTLVRIAADHGATVRQIALAFLTRKRCVFAIPKHSNANHAEENAQSVSIELSENDIGQIEKAFPRGRPRTLSMI